MDNPTAITALAALAQESRLQLFRQLVQAGPTGAAPSQLSELLNIPPSSLSFHLKELSHADLVTSTRNGRSIVYAANFAAINQLIQFLTDNCCGGNPCTPVSTPVCTPVCTPAFSPEGASS
jgi:ArsR family transcriptional regulator